MKRKLLFLLWTYVWTVVVFIAGKVSFMLYCRPQHPFSAGDVIDVIAHGLSLDLSTALYILIVPYLLILCGGWKVKGGGRIDSTAELFSFIPPPSTLHLSRVYFLIVAIALALAFVADAALYPFWGFKLDASCLQYLESPTEATASVSARFVMGAVLAFVAIAAAIYMGYYVINEKLEVRNEKYGYTQADKTADKSNHISHFSPLISHLFLLLLIPVFIIGIRGGLSESTTNIGQVYYSQNQFLNHAAVNPVFNFLYSLSHTMGNTEQYQLMNDETCQRLTADIYTTESMDNDTLLTTTRPNIVVILLESCGEVFANVMPYLQQLKQEGIYFSNCYANSWRTDRGTVCTLSGYPSFPSLSVMKMPEKSRALPGLARMLQQQGYATTYLYGGDINFTNMRSYLVSTGWEQLISMDDFTSKDRASAKWGVRDDITFKKLYELIGGGWRVEGGGRIDSTLHLWGYSTLSSHEPWDVPTHHTPMDKVQNAFAYLDDCLKNFVESLKQMPVWDNLLIVMVADHGINYGAVNQTRPLEKNHIPMLWVGGAVKEPRLIDRLCNQTDLAATLLGQLRLPHDEFTFSRDVLSKTYQHPTAVNNYNNAQLLIDSTGHVLYDFDARQLTIIRSDEAEELVEINKAILQATTKDLSGLRPK